MLTGFSKRALRGYLHTKKGYLFRHPVKTHRIIIYVRVFLILLVVSRFRLLTIQISLSLSSQISTIKGFTALKKITKKT